MADKLVEKEDTKIEVLDNDYEEVSMEERIINIEKKVKASFWMNIILIILVILTTVFNNVGANNIIDTGGDTDTVDTSYDTSAFTKITPADIASISDGKTVVVWIGRQSCGYCAMYAPYMTEAAENYGITAYYIDFATIINFDVENPYITDEKAFTTLSSLTGKGEWETFAADNIGGTPLTLIIKDNKVVGGISGAAETEAIEAAFAKAGIKKK